VIAYPLCFATIEVVVTSHAACVEDAHTSRGPDPPQMAAHPFTLHQHFNNREGHGTGPCIHVNEEQRRWQELKGLASA